MITYDFKAVISIADLTPTDPDLILSMAKRRLRDETGLPKNRDILYDNVSIEMSEVGDLDKLTFKCKLSHPDAKDEELVNRKLRRFMTTFLNGFCESELESVVNKIDNLELL